MKSHIIIELEPEFWGHRCVLVNHLEKDFWGGFKREILSIPIFCHKMIKEEILYLLPEFWDHKFQLFFFIIKFQLQIPFN